MNPIVRAARDRDAEGLIALIGAVFSEYPGCVLDVDGEIPELRAIATVFGKSGGEFWVAESAGQVVGCVGYAPAHDSGGLELKKLYVAKSAREHGLGGALCGRVEHAASAKNAVFIDLWSDTRFVTAHGFYARRGYVRGPHTRALHDRSETVEYYFRKEIAPSDRVRRH